MKTLKPFDVLQNGRVVSIIRAESADEAVRIIRNRLEAAEQEFRPANQEPVGELTAVERIH